MSMNVARTASQTEWDKGDIDDFEENESKAKASKHQPKKFQRKKDTCKICQEKFSNLFMHLSRSDCKDDYGEEYEEIKKRKHDEQKAKKRKFNDQSYERNKDACKKKRQERYSQDGDGEKERNRQYKSENAEKIKETRKRYNTRFATENKVTIIFSIKKILHE